MAAAEYGSQYVNRQGGKTATSYRITTVEVTFPVAFSKVLCAHTTLKRGHSVGDYMAIFTIDTHMMTIGVYDGGAENYWLAIGT